MTTYPISTRSTGDLITAAIWNNDVAGVANDTPAAKATTAGDIWQATGAGAGARLGLTGKAGQFLRANAGETALEYAAVPAILTAKDWGLTWGWEGWANFLQEASAIAGTASADFLGFEGWTITGGAQVWGGSARTGDMNSQSDGAVTGIFFGTAGNFVTSPFVIGGWENLQVLAAINGGVAPTKCKVTIIAKAQATTAIADDCIGIANSINTTMVATGSLAIVLGATNFEYRNDGAAGVSLAVLKDLLPHKIDFDITIATRLCDIYVDGTIRATGVQLVEDTWPRAIRCHVVTGTTDWVIQAFGFKYS